MSISRRGIVGMLLGAGGAASAGIRPAEVLKATRGAPLPPLMGEAESPAFACAPNSDMLWQRTRRLRRILDSRMEDLRWGAKHMPAHIASKKSWSPAFKASEAAKEMQALRDAMEALDNETVVERLARLLGDD